MHNATKNPQIPQISQHSKVSSNSRIRLSQKIVLAIVIPLLVDSAFLAFAMKSLSELESNLKYETQITEVLSLINVMINETYSAGGSLLMYRVTTDRKFMTEAQGLVGSLQEHSQQLDQVADKMTDRPKEIDDFLRVIRDIWNSSQEMVAGDSGSYSVDQVRIAGKFRSLSKRVTRAGEELIDKHSKIRLDLQKKQSDERARLQSTVLFAGVTNLLMAIMIALFASNTFTRKWNVLLNKTRDLRMGKPLQPAMNSDDEIGELDLSIHNLATELKEARYKETVLIDRTTQVICTVDENNKVAQINPAVSKRFQYEPEQVLGTNLVSLIHEEDRDVVVNSFEQGKTQQGELTFACRLKCADGHFAHTEWTIEWSSIDKSFFCVVLDVTQRVQAENLKRDVLAMVSHDLRTPLSSIKLVLECAAVGVYGELSASGAKTVKMAQRSSDSLINMINDLIDAESYEAGGLTIFKERVAANTVLQQAISMVEPNAEKRNIKITVDCPEVEIDCDVDRLMRVLVNILGNALKFSPPDSTISATVEADSNHIRFSIADQGPGIPAEKLERIFDKYRQVGTGSEGEKKGSGLGLAISKALIEAHQGNIGAKNIESGGTEFWFSLPANETPN